jgi:hypothetical protein
MDVTNPGLVRVADQSYGRFPENAQATHRPYHKEVRADGRVAPRGRDLLVVSSSTVGVGARGPEVTPVLVPSSVDFYPAPRPSCPQLPRVPQEASVGSPVTEVAEHREAPRGSYKMTDVFLAPKPSPAVVPSMDQKTRILDSTSQRQPGSPTPAEVFP